MKRWLVLLLLAGMLSACGSSKGNMDKVLDLRSNLLKNACSFDAEITADYGDKLYSFEMNNTADNQGNIRFTVKKPESIANITGEVAEEKGRLTFDDKVLAFELLADDQITPVSAPWLLIKTLRSGYIHACEATNDGLYVQIDDSYKEDALRLDIWLDENNAPMRGEILYKGRRIITIEVDNFTFV